MTTTYVDLPHLWFHTRVTWLMTWTEALSLPPAGNLNMVGTMAYAWLTDATSNMVSHGHAPAQLAAVTNQLTTSSNNLQMDSQLGGRGD